MGKIHKLYKETYGDLNAPENRAVVYQGIFRLQEALGRSAKDVRAGVTKNAALNVKLATESQRNATKLAGQILRANSQERIKNLDAYVRVSNNIRDNQTRLVTNLETAGRDAVARARQAYARNVTLTGVQAGNTYQGVWEAVLGKKGYEPPYISSTEPSSPFILQHAQKLAEEPFDPSRFSDQVTIDNYNKLQAAAALQKASIDRAQKNSDQAQQEIEAAVAARNAGSNERAEQLLQAAAQRYRAVGDEVIETQLDPDALSERVNAALEKDSQFQALREKSDQLWETLLDDPADANRKAYAKLLSKPRFQAWAKSNGFVVGNAQVDEKGNVVSFTPGKDLMVAFRVAQKQQARRPEAGAPGPLIARKGERDMVRIVKKDGTVVLGRKMPMQAMDEEGSARISTTGGEAYVSPDEIESESVLKEKRRFTPADAIRKSRGEMDAERARRLEEAMIRSGQIDVAGVAELPEAKPAETELDKDAAFEAEMAKLQTPPKEGLEPGLERIIATGENISPEATADDPVEGKAIKDLLNRNDGPSVEDAYQILPGRNDGPSVEAGYQILPDRNDGLSVEDAYQKISAKQKRKNRAASLKNTPAGETTEVPSLSSRFNVRNKSFGRIGR